MNPLPRPAFFPGIWVRRLPGLCREFGRTVLEGYSWALIEYEQKYPLPAEAFGQKDVERIFCLEPELPAVDNLNDYILTALREKNLDYLSFFLHRYERILNRRIRVRGTLFPLHSLATKPSGFIGCFPSEKNQHDNRDAHSAFSLPKGTGPL